MLKTIGSRRVAGVICGLSLILGTVVQAADELASQATVLASPHTKVTVEDIERYIVENMPLDEVERQGVLNRPGVYREMAENIYLMRALAAEAKKAPGYDEAQAHWAARLAFQRRLVDAYHADYVRSQLKDVDWESAAREEYVANPERYERGARISAAHILLRTEDRSEAEARALAEELHERILSGEDFAALAKEYSGDGSAEKGGNLGFFGRGQMAPPFEQAAFALEKPGDISEPVKTRFGYHIIKLNERKPAGQAPFGEVKGQIIDSLQRRMGGQVWQDKIIRMRSDQALTINEELLSALREKYVSDFDVENRE